MYKLRRELSYPADGAPWLSLAERDRRWKASRDFMRERELAALIVAGARGRERYDAYLSGEMFESVVVLPLESDPVCLISSMNRILLRHEQANRLIEPWILDGRFGARTFENVAAVLSERGLQTATIGVVGLSSEGPMEQEGLITHVSWTDLMNRLPEVRTIDVSHDFKHLMLSKSEEELDVARAAARIGEDATSAMLETTRVGATDAEVYAATLQTT